MQKLFILLLPALSLFATLQDAAEEIVRAGVLLNEARLCPATSGNISRKVDENLIAVTVSGKHKGQLRPDDVILVDLEGIPQGTLKRPSAETLLHTLLYKADPTIGAVLHTHSANAIVLTRILASSPLFVTEGYEIHKVFGGIKTHESILEFPIFENSQDYVALSSEIEQYLHAHPDTYAFLLRGHGVYIWGRNMSEALIRVEALENLLECELKLKTFGN